MPTQNPLFQKFFPEDFSIETLRAIIRPMKPGDYEAFVSLQRTADTFKYFTKDISIDSELKQWVDDALREKAEGKRMPFTITDRDTNEICGSMSYGNISFFDQRVEIGWSWLANNYIGMGVNMPVKFALLSYAFEVMKMERVEAKTDFLNERAKAGLLKIGMIPEGVLRSHMLMPDGRRRDSAYYSILRDEWPERKKIFFSHLL
ncbi:MAG: GNAT family N-acetyltransferase [Chitinophagaceae bacterium]|nr:GNAT family N-acetyltransferase [Chitinophagaceae bacterium]